MCLLVCVGLKLTSLFSSIALQILGSLDSQLALGILCLCLRSAGSKVATTPAQLLHGFWGSSSRPLVLMMEAQVPSPLCNLRATTSLEQYLGVKLVCSFWTCSLTAKWRCSISKRKCKLQVYKKSSS